MLILCVVVIFSCGGDDDDFVGWFYFWGVCFVFLPLSACSDLQTGFIPATSSFPTVRLFFCFFILSVFIWIDFELDRFWS